MMKLGAQQHQVQCPHCGADTLVDVDASNGDQQFYEDCRVCCNPISLRLHIDELNRTVQLFVDTDNEQLY